MRLAPCGQLAEVVAALGELGWFTAWDSRKSEEIVDLAKREHRSVNQQIKFLLEQSIATAKKNFDSR